MDEEVIPVLRVSDAAAAAAWYQRLGFGQEWEHRFEAGLPAFVSVARGRLRLFLSEHAGDARPDTLIYLRLGDLEAIAKQFGAAVEQMPWGREVRLRDLDGNRVRIGAPASRTTAQQEVVLMAEVVVPLTIRDLTREDLPSCGSARDIAQLGQTLERARRGEVDYLAVCPPSGLPVALGGVDYALTPGAGTLVQLAVHGALQSCGIGTLLIEAAEQRIRDRGLHRAELAVEEDNPRARALYVRLGYVAYGSKPESWDIDAEDGSSIRYETVCTLMRKQLR